MRQKIDIYLPATPIVPTDFGGGIWLTAEKGMLFDIAQARMDSKDLDYADCIDLVVRFYREDDNAE